MNPSPVANPAVCLCAALPLLLAAGCASGPEIRLSKSLSADLYSYRTFAFAEPVSTDTSLAATIANGRLLRAAREALERRNYVYDERHPDIRVGFTSGDQDALTLTLLDADDEFVWQGVAEGRAVRKTLSDPESTVDAMVSDLLIGFPLRVRT